MVCNGSEDDSCSNGLQASRSYPQLYRLLSPGARIPDGLQLFARLGPLEEQDRFIETLSHFDKGNRNAKQHATAAGPSEDDKEEPIEDYSSHVQYLYQAVSQHCICQRDEGVKHPIIANVHLGSPQIRARPSAKSAYQSSSESSSGSSSGSSDSSPEPSDDSASQSSDAASDSESDPPINFHVLFIDHPHGPVSVKFCRWQDTRIAVSKPRKCADLEHGSRPKQ
jgi:hypothetical protein